MFQILDTVSWARGSHLVKTGFDFRSIRQGAYRDVLVARPPEFFRPLHHRQRPCGSPAGISVRYNGAILDNPQKLRSTSWSGFVQDSWRLRNNLTVYGGPAIRIHCSRGGCRRSGNPLRSGLRPTGSRRTRARCPVAATNRIGTTGRRASVLRGPLTLPAKTVIRTGYGIYYNQGALATGEGLYFNAPYFDLSLNVPAPGVPPITLQNPFPQNYPASLPSSATGYQRDLKTPWLEHWNVSIQRQLGDAVPSR